MPAKRGLVEETSVNFVPVHIAANENPYDTCQGKVMKKGSTIV